MNKIKNIGLLLLMLFVVASFAVQPTPATNGNPRPVILPAPRGDQGLFAWLQGSMIPVIFGMKDANFSSGNVLYTEFTTHNVYSQSLARIVQNTSLNLDLTTFKSDLSAYIATHPKIGPVANDLLVNLSKQIGSNNQLDKTSFTMIMPQKSDNVTSHFVVVLYDPDKSVINAINDIRNNVTLTSQPFDGDEILTTVQLDRTVQSIYGQFATRNDARYNNGTMATAFIELGQFMNNHPYIARQIVQGISSISGTTNDTTFQSIRQFVTSSSSLNKTLTSASAVRNVNLGFTVSQLQIHNLDLAKRLNGNVYIKNFNATLVENHALGVTLYNDTNGNGIMDLAMKTVTSNRPGLNETVLPSGSEEAMYRVDFSNAQSTTYNPAKTATINGNQELSFGINSQNVNVLLNPVQQNQDNSFFEDNSSTITQSISQFGLNFHFMPNVTAGTAQVKFDYNMGTWSNVTTSNGIDLNGLSLNQMFLTSISDFSGSHRTMAINNNNSPVNNNGTAARAGKFVINAGQSPIAQISLDSNPYIYDGTTNETAYGLTLPLLFASYLFGRISTNGQIVNTVIGTANRANYIYSLSYPVWNGNRISNDPTFSMVVTSANTSSGASSTTTKGLPGFELVGFAVLPVLYFIKKRKQA